MALRYSVEEMISAFGAIYRTIDIRSAMIWQREKDRWANVYAVIRLSYEEPTDAERRLRGLEREHGAVRTETFQVLLSQRPFSEWADVYSELAHARLNVADTEVHLAQDLNFAQERAYLGVDYNAIRPFDSWSWPVAHYSSAPYNSGPLTNDALIRAAVRLGYSDAYEAVNLLCELNIREGQSNGYHFLLSLPVFAAISELQASLKDRRMEVRIRRHRALQQLRGTAIFRGPRTISGEPPKRRVAIEKFSDSGGNADLRSASASVRLLKVAEDDSVEVKLLHRDMGELHSRSSWSIRNLVSPPERSILFEALKFFCPEPKLTLLLGSPHKIEPKKLKPDAAFELHVAWLLGFFGLSTAVLGEYENIVAPETKVHRGSVDILAASQRNKSLVLVGCTIGAPKEDDFTNLLNTVGIVAREVFAGTAVRVLPLVCTGVRGFAPYKDIVEGLSGLPILDGNRLELLLKLVRMGWERNFISFLYDPVHSELREPQ